RRGVSRERGDIDVERCETEDAHSAAQRKAAASPVVAIAPLAPRDPIVHEIAISIDGDGGPACPRKEAAAAAGAAAAATGEDAGAAVGHVRGDRHGGDQERGQAERPAPDASALGHTAGAPVSADTGDVYARPIASDRLIVRETAQEDLVGEHRGEPDDRHTA